ncbi:MAG: hypothetical protein ABI847_01405 [Anaerolineales bacterium]
MEGVDPIIKRMQPTGEKGRLLVVCDNARLYTTLVMNLQNRWEVQRAGDSALGWRLSPRGPLEVIIVALSHEDSEPLVALAQAGLADHIGRVPLLVISSRPFAPDLQLRILHLDFPFEPGALELALQSLKVGIGHD